MRGRLLAAVLMISSNAAGAADPAAADRSHGIYFNRPGATLAEEQADFARCSELAAKTVPSAQFAGGGLMGALVGGIAAGIRKAEEQQRNLDTCMVVAGWRAIYLTADEAARLKAATANDQKTALELLVGSETISMGSIGRVLANDFAEPKLLAVTTK